MSMLNGIFLSLFLFYLGYFLLQSGYYLVCGILALRETRLRERQHGLEDYRSLSVGMFTLPVSVLIPAHNEQAWILDSVKSALQLSYPQFEVVVIDDGSTDDTFGILSREYDLEAADTPSVTRLAAGRILQCYRSRRDPRLRVVRKEPGLKKAGALNAGVEYAVYPYVCVLDADTILEKDALLKVMAHMVRDPESIVAAGSYFGLVNGCRVKDGTIVSRSFSWNPLVASQNLEYLRSFLGTRVTWSRYNATPIVAGGFGIWRKDFLFEIGGFSPEHSSEDVEVTFRAHRYLADKGLSRTQLLMLPYFVGWTDGPQTLSDLLRQRDRWQRCMLEAIWQYRDMIANPRYGNFGVFLLPYFLFAESLGVLVEVSSMACTLLAWATGALRLEFALAFFVLICLSQVLLTMFSLCAFVRSQQVFSLPYLWYLVGLSLVETLWYRWLLAWGKITGTAAFLRGERGFSQYRKKHS